MSSSRFVGRNKWGEGETQKENVFNLSHPRAEFELRSDFYLIRTVVNITWDKINSFAPHY